MSPSNALDPEDHVAILSLYARYCWTHDDGDGEGWADCFTQDANFFIDGQLWRSSRAELLEKRREPVAGAPRQHWNGSVLLTQVGSGRVEGRAQLVALDVVDGLPLIQMVGAYRDQVVLDEGVWRFARREITTFYSAIDRELYRNRELRE